MAYDLELAERIRDVLASIPDVVERKMFGGLAFLIQGHMTVVASGQGGMMVRSDPKAAADVVATTPAEFFEMRGRPMGGWLYLALDNLRSEDDLSQWVERSVSYAATLPPKR